MRDAEKPAAHVGSPVGPDDVSIADAPTPDAQSAFLAETSAHSRSTKRGWIIGGVVMAVLLLAAIGWALWPKPAPDTVGSSASPAPSSSSLPGTNGSTESSLPASSADSTGLASPGAPNPKNSRRRAPAPPGAVAVVGSKLVQIDAPPERTIGMLVVPKGFTPATSTIVFEPYGWGPGGQQGGRLLAKIVTSTATNASATALKKDFAGRNVTMWASPQVVTGLTVGGTYQGVMQVRPQGDVGVLYLVSAKRVK